MKAMIYYAELKRLMDATKDFTSKNDNKPIHTYVRLEFHKDDLSVRASALDGYMLSTEWGSCGDFNKEFTEDFTVLLKPWMFARIGKCEYLVFSRSGNEVTIATSDGVKFSYQMPSPDDFLNVDAAIPKDEATYRIGFNGKMLMTMLKAASVYSPINRPVVLELRRPLSPAILRTTSERGHENVKMVMPMRLKDGV